MICAADSSPRPLGRDMDGDDAGAGQISRAGEAAMELVLSKKEY
jgi:hypothetical protein